MCDDDSEKLFIEIEVRRETRFRYIKPAGGLRSREYETTVVNEYNILSKQNWNYFSSLQGGGGGDCQSDRWHCALYHCRRIKISTDSQIFVWIIFNFISVTETHRSVFIQSTTLPYAPLPSRPLSTISRVVQLLFFMSHFVSTLSRGGRNCDMKGYSFRRKQLFSIWAIIQQNSIIRIFGGHVPKMLHIQTD